MLDYFSNHMMISCDPQVVQQAARARLQEIAKEIAGLRSMISDAFEFEIKLKAELGLELERVQACDVDSVIAAVRHRADDFGPPGGDEGLVVNDTTYVALTAALMIAELESRTLPLLLVADRFVDSRIALSDMVGLQRPLVMRHIRAHAAHRAPRKANHPAAGIGLIEMLSLLRREHDAF